jgi:hypothetical protein
VDVLLESNQVGIPLTQVAPICSVRAWLRNTPGTCRSWRRSSGPRRRAEATLHGCDGRTVSAVRVVVAIGRSRFERRCWSARVVATKLL